MIEKSLLPSLCQKILCSPCCLTQKSTHNDIFPSFANITYYTEETCTKHQ